MGNDGYLIHISLVLFLFTISTLRCYIVHFFFCFHSILEAYRTGRGRIVMRGKTDLETIDEKTKRTAIIIKEVRIMLAFLEQCL